MNPRVHRSRVTQDRWLVSYADFITLLFAFFVVLYAFAKADQKKQMEVSASIDSGFKSLGLFSQMQGVPGKNSTDPGVLGASDFPISVRRGEDVRSAARIRDNLDAMRRELERALSTQVGASYGLDPNGTRWPGDQSSGSGLFQFGLGHAAAGDAGYTADDRRFSRQNGVRGSH